MTTIKCVVDEKTNIMIYRELSIHSNSINFLSTVSKDSDRYWTLWSSRERAEAAAVKSLQSCPTLRPQRQKPTRLPRPWDSPGQNTGVGCHFLLQCTKVKSESEVIQSCRTLTDPMDCSLPGSSIHRIFQARVLEWVATAFFKDKRETVQLIL